MRKWTRAQYERLAKEKLTKREFEKWSCPEGLTIGEYKKRCYNKAIPFEKIVGCSCWQIIHQEFLEAVELLGNIIGNDIRWKLVKKDTSMGRAWRRGLKRIALQYARQRLCHMSRKGLLCYCDEHQH